jgi:hypothetical protein
MLEEKYKTKVMGDDSKNSGISNPKSPPFNERKKTNLAITLRINFLRTLESNQRLKVIWVELL